jgi:hypothetical protein
LVPLMGVGSYPWASVVDVCQGDRLQTMDHEERSVASATRRSGSQALEH